MGHKGFVKIFSDGLSRLVIVITMPFGFSNASGTFQRLTWDTHDSLTYFQTALVVYSVSSPCRSASGMLLARFRD